MNSHHRLQQQQFLQLGHRRSASSSVTLAHTSASPMNGLATQKSHRQHTRTSSSGNSATTVASSVAADSGSDFNSAAAENFWEKKLLRLQKDYFYDYERRLREFVASKKRELVERPPWYIVALVYFQCAVIILFGKLRDLLGIKNKHCPRESPKQMDFAPLYSDFESFITTHGYIRIRDSWNRPICSVPGAETVLKDRISNDYCWTFEYIGTKTRAVNFGSYNYLGFAQNSGKCACESAKSIEKFGIGVCSTKREFGNTVIHRKLEKAVAQFLGVEDSICFPMGFGTNSLNLPCFVGKGCLIISDQFNHASLVLGSRLSGAHISVFKHNDIRDLEAKLREAVVHGQPRNRRPYKKILIIVEGVYSMEGTICNLPEIIALKKKYKAYLYLDEAHSIGALGTHGRGVCDYWNCNPKDVDILMGTFTKSFGSAGGYIAGNRAIIDHLRVHSHNAYYASTLSGPVAQQIISVISVIMGQDGTDDGINRIRQLSRNSVYFRKRLKQMGFIVYGRDDSPVVPLMLYTPSKTSLLSRELLKRRIALVVVGFPATAVTLFRARFCMSSSHTKEHLDRVLKAIDEVGDLVSVKFVKDKHYVNETIDYYDDKNNNDSSASSLSLSS